MKILWHTCTQNNNANIMPICSSSLSASHSTNSFSYHSQTQKVPTRPLIDWYPWLFLFFAVFLLPITKQLPKILLKSQSDLCERPKHLLFAFYTHNIQLIASILDFLGSNVSILCVFVFKSDWRHFAPFASA